MNAGIFARLGALFLVATIGASARGASPCEPEGGLAYVCGFQKPEDVVAIPGSAWLIVSGFSPGAGLRFLDTRDRTVRVAYSGEPAQLAPDRRRFARCPGPVDPAVFNARGLSLRATAADRWQLLVVNHGGRESVEVFDVRLEPDGPRLRWNGCLPMPEGHVGNAVAAFADGTVLVTVLTRPGTTIADFVEGRPTGDVWRWPPGARGFERVPGTSLPGNNGIEADPDGRHFYVVAFGWHAVAVFDRERDGGPVATLPAADFMPDNLHFTSGRLLLAGMRLDEPACGGLRRVVDGVADPMLCHRGWIVGEVRVDEGRISTVAYGTPVDGFNGLSAAALIGRELWLGSFQSDRVAVATLP